MARSGRQFTAGRDDDGRRLERVLRKLFPEVPRSALNKALRKGDVRINGVKVKADHRLTAGEEVEIRASFAPEAKPPRERASAPAGGATPRARATPRAHAQGGAFDAGSAGGAGASVEVLYRDEDLIAINKEAGISVHGERSLTGQVRALLAGTAQPSLSFRPGPLHRLDKGTTGVIVYSVSLEGARRFSQAMRERRLKKIYLALLRGTLPSPARWLDLLEQEGKGREAELSVVPIIRVEGATIAACMPKTGRTHQIRRQAALRGYPLVGDHAYQGDHSGRSLPGGYILHALSLSAERDGELGFTTILAPLPEATANRLASWVTSSRPVEPALPESGATAELARRLSRPVERLTEEPEAAPFLLATIAAQLHDHRSVLHDAV